MIYIVEQLIINVENGTTNFDTTTFGAYNNKAHAQMRFQKILNDAMLNREFDFEGTKFKMPVNCLSKVTSTFALYFTEDRDFVYELKVISTPLKK